MSTDTMDYKTAKIPVLTSSNYVEWIDLVEDVLRSKNLWKYAVGEDTPEEKTEEFLASDARAVAFLKSAAGREQRAHLLGLHTSKQVLGKLKAVHEVSQQERVQSLLTQFHGFKASSTIDLSASRLTHLQLEIAAASPEEKPTESSKKTVLIHSLSDEYQSTVFALRAAGLSKMTFDDIVQRLKEVELSLEKEGDSENLARIARGKSYPKSRPRRDLSTVECYRCHKFGHYQGQCKTKLTQKNKDQQERAGEAAAAAWPASYSDENAMKSTYVGSQDWVLDSGCTRHMTQYRGYFIDFVSHEGIVTIADRKTLSVQGGGTIEVPIGGKKTQITGVIYVPDIGYNLLSVSQLADRGITCQFTESSACLKRDGKIIATARRRDNSYVIKGSGEKATLAREDTDSVSLLWHRRLGHIGNSKMQLLTSEVVQGVPDGLKPSQGLCETCELTKSVKKINKEPAARASKPLERVHIDFWGPYKYETVAGNRFMFTVTDDFSRKSWVCLSKTREAVHQIFQGWKNQAELESRYKLKAVRMDNAPELLKLGKRLESEGVRIEPTETYTPSQNGVAERLNRTLITKARSMLAAAGLPKSLWGEAVHTACYLKNLTPDTEGTTPRERWDGKKPSLGHLRVFGCIAYPHIPQEKRDKLDSTASKGVLVGYAQTTKQYRIYNPAENTVRLSSSVRFDENKKGGDVCDGETYKVQQEAEEQVFELQESPEHPLSPANDDDTLSTIEVRPRPSGNIDSEEEEETRPSSQGTTEEDEVPHQRVTRHGRKIRLPTRYNEGTSSALSAAYQPVDLPTPLTYEDATNGEQAYQWNQAIQDHLQSLASNHTWSIIDKPKDVNLVSTKWVFKIKTLPNGQIDKYKARLCARGFSQQYGIDYFETFSPVVRMESLRVLLALAASHNLEVHQMDVVSAYLLGELEEDVYIDIPEGLSMPEGKVLKLQKGLPGLKQSGNIWNKRITNFFRGEGLEPIAADPSIFTNTSCAVIVALYVDDLIILSKSVGQIEALKTALSETFEMKDLGEARFLLGISINRDREQGTITINQHHYIHDLLREEDLTDNSGAAVPADGYKNLGPLEDDDPSTGIVHYQRLIGKLNWLVRGTRADIAYTVQKLSQHAHKPGIKHLAGAQQVLRYLKETATLGIQYKGDLAITGYSDADFAADSSRKSVMGFIFIAGKGPVTWSSKIQRSVTTSTTEAEYHALAYAAKEAVWLQNLLGQLKVQGNKSTLLYGDNNGSIALVQNPLFHAKTKHIDVSVHYTRELYKQGKIKLEYIPTSQMLADCLTKPLKKAQHQRALEGIGFINTV